MANSPVEHTALRKLKAHQRNTQTLYDQAMKHVAEAERMADLARKSLEDYADIPKKLAAWRADCVRRGVNPGLSLELTKEQQDFEEAKATLQAYLDAAVTLKADAQEAWHANEDAKKAVIAEAQNILAVSIRHDIERLLKLDDEATKLRDGILAYSAAFNGPPGHLFSTPPDLKQSVANICSKFAPRGQVPPGHNRSRTQQWQADLQRLIDTEGS